MRSGVFWFWVGGVLLSGVLVFAFLPPGIDWGTGVLLALGISPAAMLVVAAVVAVLGSPLVGLANFLSWRDRRRAKHPS